MSLDSPWIISLSGRSRGTLRCCVRVTPGRRHDGPVFQVGKWVAGKLLMFDLGYFRYQLFDRIARNHGFFQSRLKANANPVIVAQNAIHRGRARNLVGQHVWQAIEGLARETIDVTVQVEFKRRGYAGRTSSGTRLLRVVGVGDETTGEYHLHIMNVEPDRLPAQDVQTTYALRWQIELLFTELKRHYHLEEMPSSKPEVVEALLHAAIVTLVVSRTLLEAVRKQLGALAADRTPTQRWAAVLESVATDLLSVAPGGARQVRELVLRISTTMLREAVDPNAGRPQLLQAVESGKHAYRVRVPSANHG